MLLLLLLLMLLLASLSHRVTLLRLATTTHLNLNEPPDYALIIHRQIVTFSNQPHPLPRAAIAPLIMAELRIGNDTLAATDASWKTHTSQVGACAASNKPPPTNQNPPPATHRIPHPPPPPLQVSHIGTWRDGSFGGDALDDNMIVEGWDRCVRRVCGCCGVVLIADAPWMQRDAGRHSVGQRVQGPPPNINTHSSF